MEKAQKMLKQFEDKLAADVANKKAQGFEDVADFIEMQEESLYDFFRRQS